MEDIRRKDLEDLLNDLNIGKKEISIITGIKLNSVKTLLNKKKEIPRWLRFSVFVYREMLKKIKDNEHNPS